MDSARLLQRQLRLVDTSAGAAARAALDNLRASSCG